VIWHILITYTFSSVEWKAYDFSNHHFYLNEFYLRKNELVSRELICECQRMIECLNIFRMYFSSQSSRTIRTNSNSCFFQARFKTSQSKKTLKIWIINFSKAWNFHVFFRNEFFLDRKISSQNEVWNDRIVMRMWSRSLALSYNEWFILNVSWLFKDEIKRWRKKFIYNVENSWISVLHAEFWHFWWC
jgi:hypothetical protein